MEAECLLTAMAVLMEKRKLPQISSYLTLIRSKAAMCITCDDRYLPSEGVILTDSEESHSYSSSAKQPSVWILYFFQKNPIHGLEREVRENISVLP